jgi:hypothetical protein
MRFCKCCRHKDAQQQWLSPVTAAGGKQLTSTAKLGVNRCKSVVLADSVTAVNVGAPAVELTVTPTAATGAATCVLSTAVTTWPKVHTNEPGSAGTLKLPAAGVPVPRSPAFVYNVQVIVGLLRVVCSCMSSAAVLVMVAVYVMVAPGSR